MFGSEVQTELTHLYDMGYELICTYAGEHFLQSTVNKWHIPKLTSRPLQVTCVLRRMMVNPKTHTHTVINKQLTRQIAGKKGYRVKIAS